MVAARANRPDKWTLEELRALAAAHNTKSEFRAANGGAYLAAWKMGVLSEICSHMEQRRLDGASNPSFRWTSEDLHKAAMAYKTRSEFKAKNSRAYNVAHKRGLLDEICQHMIKKEVSKRIPDEVLLAEAAKYNTKKEFKSANLNAYSLCVKRKLIDKACAHMAKIDRSGPNHHNYKYSNEDLAREALKYSTRIAFFTKSSKKYNIAQLRGILEQICQHMKKPGTMSMPEVDLFNIIKEKYPKAQRFRDSKARVEGKPLIKGFDIDIYVPELRKGIEFDGTYWHSVAGLKRSRRDWPDTDLLNYHNIKDAYFRSKNIELLHIKEEEWDSDRNICIVKCLEFLALEKAL